MKWFRRRRREIHVVHHHRVEYVPASPDAGPEAGEFRVHPQDRMEDPLPSAAVLGDDALRSLGEGPSEDDVLLYGHDDAWTRARARWDAEHTHGGSEVR